MTRTYSALPHLNGNLMVAVDVETTGNRPKYHEVIQIAVVPLNSDLRPLEGVGSFYKNVRPEYPERADPKAMRVNGLDLEDLRLHAPSQDDVAESLIRWFNRLDLPFEKNLVPLAHNWAFENSFLKAWLGVPLVEKLFFGLARDAMLTALYLNDKAVFRGEPAPFGRVGLDSLGNKFNIINPQPHDAYYDCLAEAEIYRCLVMMDVF